MYHGTRVYARRVALPQVENLYGEDLRALSEQRPAIWAWTTMLLCIPVCLKFAPWLIPFELPQRGGPHSPFRPGDLTPLFSVWNQVTAQSIFEHGELPLWSSHIYGGEPFFAKAQIGVLSLTTLLTGALAAVTSWDVGEAAQVMSTWTFLLHLIIAGLTATLLCRYLLKSWSCAPVDAFEQQLAAIGGGVSFMLCPMLLDHAQMGHGPIVLAACWSPLVLYFAIRAMDEDRVGLCAVAASLLGAQLLAGGATVFLYTAVGCGLSLMAWWIGSIRTCSAAVRSGRVLKMGIVLAVVGSLIAAIKVVPGLELLPLTNRAGGLPLELAFIGDEYLGTLAFRLLNGDWQAVSEWRKWQLVIIALLCVGLWARRSNILADRWKWGLCLAWLAAGLALSQSENVFSMARAIVPLFSMQRLPQRALLLTYLGMAPLIAMGIQVCLVRFRRQRIRRGLTFALVIAIGVEELLAASPLEPTADIRREIEANRILNHVANKPGPFRLHTLENLDRNWGIEHVTVPLNLANLVGWDHMWQLEYLGAEGTLGRDVMPFLPASYRARNTARFWGLLNVRYVTARRPTGLAGLELIQRFDACELCQPPKSSGRLLYENGANLPRAWHAPQAIAVIGDLKFQTDASYRIIDRPEFDPQSWGVLRGGSLDELHLPERSKQPRVIRSHSDLDPFLIELDANPNLQASLMTPEVQLRAGRTERIDLQATGTPSYLLLSEKYAHFPGWQVSSDQGPRPLLKADVVISAIPLTGQEHWLEFRYRPRSLVIGSLLSLVGVLAASVLFWTEQRRTTSRLT